MLPGHPLARHIEDFLTDLANANKPRNTIRAYRGDLTGFAGSGGVRRAGPAAFRGSSGAAAGSVDDDAAAVRFTLIVKAGIA